MQKQAGDTRLLPWIVAFDYFSSRSFLFVYEKLPLHELLGAAVAHVPSGSSSGWRALARTWALWSDDLVFLEGHNPTFNAYASLLLNSPNVVPSVARNVGIRFPPVHSTSSVCWSLLFHSLGSTQGCFLNLGALVCHTGVFKCCTEFTTGQYNVQSVSVQ